MLGRSSCAQNSRSGYMVLCSLFLEQNYNQTKGAQLLRRNGIAYPYGGSRTQFFCVDGLRVCMNEGLYIYIYTINVMFNLQSLSIIECM